MSAQQHSLVDIPIESLPSLRDSFKVNWPEHIIAFNLIDNLIDRFAKHPEHRQILKILSVDGDISDSTFIAILDPKDVIIATLDKEFRLLKIGIRLIDFKTKKMFMDARTIYHDAITEMIQEKNLKTLFEDKTVMVYLSKEDALKLEVNIPENIELKSLSPGDAEKINSVWPYASPESLDYIRYVITYNRSVGLYEKSSGELIAWCLEHDFYCLMALQVDVNHLRKGYGSLVAKAITKKIAKERDSDVVTNIIVTNYKSQDLFKKLGFKVIDENFWIGAIENDKSSDQ